MDAVAMPLGGGTDLRVLMDEAFASPSTLIDLRHVAGMREIEELPDGHLRIGGGVPTRDRGHKAGLRAPALVADGYAVRACRPSDAAAETNLGRGEFVSGSHRSRRTSRGTQLDDDAIATLAERALWDARPRSDNGYKVVLARALRRNAVRDLTA